MTHNGHPPRESPPHPAAWLIVVSVFVIVPVTAVVLLGALWHGWPIVIGFAAGCWLILGIGLFQGALR